MVSLSRDKKRVKTKRVDGSDAVANVRAAAFRELVKEVDSARVLVVRIDVATASWFVLGCALDGEVVLNGTKIAATAEGMACLEQLLDRARRERAAELVVVGIEAAGTITRPSPPTWTGAVI